MITIVDVVGRNGKLPDQCSQEELFEEVFNQLLDSFPNLSKPTRVLLDKNVSYDGYKWISKDDAYVMTTDEQIIPIQSCSFDNLYSIGSHSGKSVIPFTSMESAITNGIYLCHLLENKSVNDFIIRKPTNLSSTLLILILLIVISIYLIKKSKVVQQ